MTKYILAAALAVSMGSAPLVAAHAGEGNGPSFPGLQVPDVGVTTGPAGRRIVATTDEHSSSVYAGEEPQSRVPQYGTAAQRTRTWAMLRAASPND